MITISVSELPGVDDAETGMTFSESVCVPFCS